MLFNEIYGSYFRVVAAIVSAAAEEALTAGKVAALVREKAFAESTLTIPSALQSGAWPLIDADLRPVLHRKPTMPLSTLQKRWLKALLSDPRIALFSPDMRGLEDVEPLYSQDTFIRFDQYGDGDPYSDPDYITCFQTVLRAVHGRRRMRIRFHGHTGARHSIICAPYRLEYSEKDDKFRVLAAGMHRQITVNVARIRSCELLEEYEPASVSAPPERLRELTLLLRDERNGLERVLLHFSHFEKETRKIDELLYEIKLRYDSEDETELLIRVLSFGPILEVTAPAEFRQLIKNRIQKQHSISANCAPSHQNY